jgi:K+-transporting ATPase ATPase C chain
MKQLKIALLMLGVLSLLLGIVYPLVITGIAQLVFPFRANGSLIEKSEVQSPRSRVTIGSLLIGQSFSSPGYFHGRPSDCGYDAANSAASNLGPSNPKLFEQVQARIDTVRGEDGLADTASVPADLVLSSASGLDPEITPSSALLQIVRIANVRHLEVAMVRHLVEQHTEQPFLGVFGQERVNVLKLNLALDSMTGEAK